MELTSTERYLSQNTYPGRGILLGRSPDGEKAMAAYFIMGRSKNSRNRFFAVTGDGIRTEAADPSLMEDPSLIIYHPVRIIGNTTIVTNGDQTDTIRDALADGKSYIQALRTRSFEPDAPNYTPRISGILQADGGISLSVLKSLNGNPSCCVRNFFEYDHLPAGIGLLIHTYKEDGNPLPSICGEPVLVSLADNNIDIFGNKIWDSLNQDNKISLWVSSIEDNGNREVKVYNKYKRV